MSKASSSASSLLLTRMRRVEIGIAVDAADDSLAIELALPVLQRGFNDAREALGPVIAAAGDQPHAIAVALDAQPVAVELDFVEPLAADRPRANQMASQPSGLANDSIEARFTTFSRSDDGWPFKSF